VEMLKIKANERAKIYQRARAHDIVLGPPWPRPCVRESARE
jgi:hypothetical protein